MVFCLFIFVCFLSTVLVLEGTNEVYLESCFLQAAQLQLTEPFFVGDVPPLIMFMVIFWTHPNISIILVLCTS